MKIPSTSSILLTGLAVSSSALVTPTPDGHQESGLSSSNSHDTLASRDAIPSVHRDSVSARGPSSLVCDIAQVLGQLLSMDFSKACPSGAKQGEGDRSPDPARAQEELAQLADILDKATFPSMPGSVKLPVNGNPAAALVNESPAAPLVNGSPAAAVINGSPVAAAINGSPVADAINGNPATAAISGSPAAAVINGSPAAAAINESPAAPVINGSPAAAVIHGVPVVGLLGGSRADGSGGQSESTANLSSSSLGSASVSSAISSSARGTQPTPTNSPTIPIDDPASNASHSTMSTSSPIV